MVKCLTVAFELLPQKIASTKRVLNDLALDLDVLRTIPEASPEQIAQLEKSFRIHQALLAEYERRQQALEDAASGKDHSRKNG